MKAKIIALFLSCCSLLVQAASVTDKKGDSIWEKNSSGVTTFVGSVTLDGAVVVFGSGLSSLSVGDSISYTGYSQLVTDSQIQRLFGTNFFVGGSIPNQRHASFELALEEKIYDPSPTGDNDIRSGSWFADSHGACYYSDAFDFCPAAEDVVNSIIANAKTSASVLVYVTESSVGDLYSTVAPNLAPISAAPVPEPQTFVLMLAGFCGIVCVKLRRRSV